MSLLFFKKEEESKNQEFNFTTGVHYGVASFSSWSILYHHYDWVDQRWHVGCTVNEVLGTSPSGGALYIMFENHVRS